jgi:hypothetical protein
MVNWESRIGDTQRVTALTVSCALFCGVPVFGQDAIHPHPTTVVYVLKGGRIKYTTPDGSVKIVELKTGETLIRPPVTHADEALDDVDAILVEIKQ